MLFVLSAAAQTTQRRRMKRPVRLKTNRQGIRAFVNRLAKKGKK